MKSDQSPLSSVNNARFLEPEAVAASFVPPPYFSKLFAVKNQLLVGPRGSGKTTLLKMLRLTAIDAWAGRGARSIRETIAFAAVFVPADVSWSGRVRAQADALPEAHGRAYTQAALSLLVRRALVEAFSERTGQRTLRLQEGPSNVFESVKCDSHSEVRLCERLISRWKLRDAVPTLQGLKSAISGELVELRIALDEAMNFGNVSRVEAESRRLSMPIVDSVIHAVDVFEEITAAGKVKWALLFDELEIAPQWLQEELLQSLRSTDQRLIFKLAITPCSAAASYVGGVTQPHRGDDYDEIPLWYSDPRDAQRFSQELWARVLETRKIPALSPRAVLGESIGDEMDPVVGATSGRYARRGIWHSILLSLAKKDVSFSEYLRRRGVNLASPESIDRKKMDSVLRKVAPIAVYREYFLKEANPQHSHRSRKKVSLYSGARNIFRVTEGNPRWYLGLIDQILDNWQNQRGSITRPQQATIVEAFANRFLSTVAAYPNPALSADASSQFKGLTVTKLIEKLGDFAFEEIAGPKFNDDPNLAFKVDVDDPLINSLLSVAVNAGALVLEDAEDSGHFMHSLKGRVLRLSFHLAPRFRIPLRSGRAVSLSVALKMRARARRDRHAQVDEAQTKLEFR